MSYYVFDFFSDPFNCVRIRDEWRGFCFYGSSRIKSLSDDRLPVEFDLEKPDKGPLQLCGAYPGTYPLLSDEVLEVLYRLGVDNLDVFPALLHNSYGPEPVVLRNYKAVAIMGAIACVDRKRSGQIDIGDETGLLQDGVDKMYLDESKADGLLIFRPRPGMGTIVVHERVKMALEAAKIPGLWFYSTSESGGF